MLDTIKKLKTTDREYPIAFTFNVIESIQEEYGTFTAWNQATYPDDMLPNIKNMKWSLLQMINEGIKKVNKTNVDKQDAINMEDVENIMEEISLIEIDQVVGKLIASFFDSAQGKEKDPNAKTTKGKKK